MQINHLLSFWGKAQPRDQLRGAAWHPLVFHCIDVAAVGEALLEKDRGLLERISGLLGLDESVALPILRHLLCLHDVGKFAKRFQAKAPDHYPHLFGNDAADISTRYDHGAGGLRLFDEFPTAFGIERNERSWRPLISAVTGHHGSPPDVASVHETLKASFGKIGIDAAVEFLGQVQALFAPSTECTTLDEARARRASHSVAGLAVLADWIGSNQDWFPYHEPAPDLNAYWCRARAQGDRAVAEAGILPEAASRQIDYKDLITVSNQSDAKIVPTPMQSWAESVELPEGPALFLIEDETGSGKTEAALMLAHRLLAAGRADRLYVALPTMATANAMFDRLGRAYRRLFAPDTNPSIALAHGARDLHDGFRSVAMGKQHPEHPYVTGTEGEWETTASMACAAWLADDRRRAFLADAGAGTIDQALLAVLPTRHQSLRLLGLMRSVLILDEVHAYDAYMLREMERLIEFQAGLGGSTVMLSATLPQNTRARLTSAFGKVIAADWMADDPAMNYPLATVCTTSGTSSVNTGSQPGRERRVPVRFLRSPDDAYREVEKAAQAGQAVLYLRNSVDDVLDAADALGARGLSPLVFHARYALGDRLDIERRVLRLFGKEATPADRRGTVLVATQVVEQSLDLDFDCMVTDLAPIDLIIQRVGRLWRHRRPERSGSPELLIVGPQPVDEPNETWFADCFPRAAYVYPNHARLWLTARVLEQEGGIESPGRLRALVEAVYGDDAEADIPGGLQDIFWAQEGRSGADRSVATQNVLGIDGGYIRDAGRWSSDERTPTRLDDDPQVTLRLGRFVDDRIVPYYEGALRDRHRHWQLSEVKVAARRVGAEAADSDHNDATAAAKADWSRYDSEKLLVLLRQIGTSNGGDSAWAGTALSSGDNPQPVKIAYDPKRGLAVRSGSHSSRPAG